MYSHFINGIIYLTPFGSENYSFPEFFPQTPISFGEVSISWTQLAGVIITGVDGELLDNIYAHLQIDDEACDSPSWRINRRTVHLATVMPSRFSWRHTLWTP